MYGTIYSTIYSIALTCFPIKRMLKSAAIKEGSVGWQRQLQLDLINISPRLKVRVVCKCRNFSSIKLSVK